MICLPSVLADAVVSHVAVFQSREEVLANLPRLGEGRSVFVCYAPDPESPYFNPREREVEIHRNELRLASLFLDLELHGFHVVSDLHMQGGGTEPADFVQWYISRVSYCNFVLLVCSPAFNELFRIDRSDAIIDKRAQLLLGYKRAVYGEIMKEVKSQGNVSRFIPVLLEARWDSVDCVPVLFQGGSVYRLFEAEQRCFNYNDMTRDFEKLVCRMAGIDRMALARPQDRRPVAMLPAPHSNSGNGKQPCAYSFTPKAMGYTVYIYT